MKPNPCHSQQRPTHATRYPAQVGFFDGVDRDGNPVRTPLYRDVVHTMTCQCQYSIETDDPRCGAFPDLAMPVCPHKYVKPTP